MKKNQRRTKRKSREELNEALFSEKLPEGLSETFQEESSEGQQEEYIKKPDTGRIILLVVLAEIAILVVGVVVLILSQMHEDAELEALLEQDLTIDYIEEEPEEALYVPRPEIDEQLLTINDYSRPGIKTDGINYVVVHYLANPKTTAQQNHDYFESLKDLQNVSMSANYVIGLEGEIIQCVPDDEIAYASNSENHDSISIENCHMDETGKFTEATYNSLVKLTAYLTELYGLDRDQIIRHYDVTGKECPLYYVENEDKWEEFKDDVMEYREQCREEALTASEAETELDELAAYLKSVETESDTGKQYENVK